MAIKPHELAETAECVCLASRKAARAITREFDRQLRPTGVKPTQFSALAILSIRGALTIGALAKLLGVERTTLTRNLVLIEENGWVRIEPGEDARSRLVEVTPKGRAAAVAALPAWRATQKELVGRMGEGAATALRKVARSVR
jgi:DNA-binding MarR family transcriptional regulator